MRDLALALTSLVIGVLASAWVSRHYFKRTTDKSLTPYLQFMSSLFNGVDPSVRESLKIAYKGTAVTELLEVQFVIANTGERPIRDFIAPLTLIIPRHCSLLNASLLHCSPEGREVEITHTPQEVVFRFPLLNAGEFFITKLLLQGKAKDEDFRFTVTLDDLPPVLSAVRMPHDLLYSELKRDNEVRLFVLGFFATVIGTAVATLLYLQWNTLSQSWDRNLLAFLRENWLVLLVSVLAGIPALLLLVGGPVICVGASRDFRVSKRRLLRVPDEFRGLRAPRPLPPRESTAQQSASANTELEVSREDARA